MTIHDTLSQIEARAQAATEGPWRVDPETKDMAAGVETDKKTICIGASDHNEADFDFIASARTDVPKLVAALRLCLQGEGNDSALSQAVAAILAK